MYPLKPLSDFFNAIAGDPRISITHIGIYAALVQYWQEHEFQNPLQVFSYEIMRLAKISATTTYYKNVKDLSEFGYIKYEPSFKREQGSKIFLLNKSLALTIVDNHNSMKEECYGNNEEGSTGYS